MANNQTVSIQCLLARLQAGDEAARKDLINATCEHLTRLTRKMFRADGRLVRWEQTADVFQNAMLRLYRALQEVKPRSPREFYRLAAVQIRRELIDLARHYYGPHGMGAKHESHWPDQNGDPDGQAPFDRADTGHDPRRITVRTELHEQIEKLPDEEREVFDLIHYQALTHAEAAAVLGVSTKTVQRRWHAGCLRLHERLHRSLAG